MIRAEDDALHTGRPQLALCGRCGEALEFTFDALGRTRERCPKCQGIARHVAPAAPFVSQTRLTNIPDAPPTAFMPPVKPGQLRCQLCARGVAENRFRFCESCRAIAPREREVRPDRQRPPRSPESRIRNAAAMRAARARGPFFKPRVCACGVTFTPTSPSQRFHAPDCSARRAP